MLSIFNITAQRWSTTATGHQQGNNPLVPNKIYSLQPIHVMAGQEISGKLHLVVHRYSELHYKSNSYVNFALLHLSFESNHSCFVSNWLSKQGKCGARRRSRWNPSHIIVQTQLEGTLLWNVSALLHKNHQHNRR